MTGRKINLTERPVLFDVRGQRPIASRVCHEVPHDDWLVLPSWERLHRVHSIVWAGGSPEDEAHGEGIAICGAAGTFQIPGFLSRMGLPRCAHCCRLLGIPRGPGNTLNAGISEPPVGSPSGRVAGKDNQR